MLNDLRTRPVVEVVHLRAVRSGDPARSRVCPVAVMFLTPKELFVLTGCAQKRGQLQWLAARGWPHEVDAKGRPVVLAETVRAYLGMADAPKQEPRWDNLR